MKHIILQINLQLVFFALLAIPAAAQSQDQDRVGIYFDQDGSRARDETAASPEIVYAYVLLMNISDTEGIAGVGMMGLASDRILGGRSLIGPQNFVYDEFWSFAAAPLLPWASIIPVVEIAVVVETPETRVDLFLAPFPGQADVVYFARSGEPGAVVALSPRTGTFADPLAIINENAAVPDDAASWGEVKALYR